MTTSQTRDAQSRADALLDCADCMGVQLSERRLDSYLRLLTDVPPADLRSALEAHQRDPERGRFFPQVADIMAKLPRRVAAHPDPDAAWAIALTSFDERSTTCWTPEIAQARNAALPVWEIGDKVGARMAFKAAYAAALAEAHPSGQARAQVSPAWELSAGTDPHQRAQAVRQAQAQGLLTAERARQLMPPEQGETDPEVAKVAGLLAGKVVDLPPKTDEARRFREAVEAGIRAAKARQETEDALRAEAHARAEAKRAQGRQALQEALQALQQDRPMATPIPDRVAS